MPRTTFTVEFNDSPFRFSHSKAPRGFGSWAFSTDQTAERVFFSPAMSFAAARKWMSAQVKALAPASFVGHVSVKVLP